MANSTVSTAATRADPFPSDTHIHSPPGGKVVPPQRVAFVIPYFGRLPAWFPLWAKTAAYNPTFTWLLFGDDTVNSSIALPPNVVFHAMTLRQFHQLLSRRLNLTLAPPATRPCKPCDLKVFWGHVFRDYLTGFDWWGFTDIDVFLGNLSSRITPEVLASSDVISSYAQPSVGHFTLLRRVPKVDELPFLIRGWRKAVADSSRVYVLDEWWGSWDNLSKVIRRYRGRRGLRVWFGYNPMHPSFFVQEDSYYPCKRFRCQKALPSRVRVSWDRGTLTRNVHANFRAVKNAEVIYYHFHWTKKQVSSSVTPEIIASDHFCVTGSRRLALKCH